MALAFCKRALRVKRGTCSWAVLREAGVMPFQYYWFLAALRMWNGAIEGKGGDLVKSVMKADLELARAGMQKCWTHQVWQGLQGLQGEAGFKQAMVNKGPVLLTGKDGLAVALKRRYMGVWQGMDEVDPRGPGANKLARHHVWFAAGMRDPAVPRALFPRARYLYAPLTPEVMRNNARFRLSGHRLRVETSTWEQAETDRACDACIVSLGEHIQDEQHIALECEHVLLRDLREEFSDVFDAWRDTDGSFRAFMDLESCRLPRYISRCMAIMDEWTDAAVHDAVARPAAQ